MTFPINPGNLTTDGTGWNEPKTGALLERMSIQSPPIEQVLKRVVSQVKSSSNSQQEP